jgi:hypothetical protein
MTADDVRRHLQRVRPQGVMNQEGVVRSVLGQPEHMQQLWLDTMLDGAAKLECEVLEQYDRAARAFADSNTRYWYDSTPSTKGKK